MEGGRGVWSDDCVVLGCLPGPTHLPARLLCVSKDGIRPKRRLARGRRLLGADARDQLGAVTSRRAAEAARGDGSRHAATQSARRTRLATTLAPHVRRGRRRAVGATTRSRLGARSASPVSALREPSRRCDEESRMRRGDVIVARRRTRRRARASAVRPAQHDEVGGARSARRFARGSALARRRRRRL